MTATGDARQYLPAPGDHAGRAAFEAQAFCLYPCTDHGLERWDATYSGSAWVGAWSAVSPATLAELLDVNMAGVADGDVPIWDSATSTWLPGEAGTSGTRAISTQAGAAYEFVLADAGIDKMVAFTSAAAVTATVPTNAETAIPVGSSILISQLGAGQVTVVGDPGVTIHGVPSLTTAEQYALAELLKIGADEWLFFGRLAGEEGGGGGGGAPSWDATIASSGPVSWLKFTEASGTFADATGNGNTATANGTPTYGQTDRNGVVSAVRLIPANSAAIRWDSIAPELAASAVGYSFAVIFNVDDASGNCMFAINGSGDSNRFLVFQNGSGGIGLTLTSGSQSNVAGAYNLKEDHIMHVVARPSGSGSVTECWIDGSLKHATGFSAMTATDRVTIGAEFDTTLGDFVAMLVEEAVAWDRAITPDEIRTQTLAAVGSR